MKIIANNTPVTFGKEDLPMLISGKHGAGSSLFTIHVMHQLLKGGEKILFFTAHPAAKTDFKHLLSEEELTKAEFINKGDQMQGKQVVVLLSGEESALIDAFNQLSDIEERIVLIKNMDQFSKEAYELVREKMKVIFSGDIDETSFQEELRQTEFATQVFFSGSKHDPIDKLQDLEKYQGLMRRGGNQEIVRLQSDD